MPSAPYAYDGKIYLNVTCKENTREQFLVRLTADLALDPGFGAQGEVPFYPGSAPTLRFLPSGDMLLTFVRQSLSRFTWLLDSSGNRLPFSNQRLEMIGLEDPIASDLEPEHFFWFGYALQRSMYCKQVSPNETDCWDGYVVDYMKPSNGNQIPTANGLIGYTVYQTISDISGFGDFVFGSNERDVYLQLNTFSGASPVTKMVRGSDGRPALDMSYGATRIKDGLLRDIPVSFSPAQQDLPNMAQVIKSKLFVYPDGQGLIALLYKDAKEQGYVTFYRLTSQGTLDADFGIGGYLTQPLSQLVSGNFSYADVTFSPELLRTNDAGRDLFR